MPLTLSETPKPQSLDQSDATAAAAAVRHGDVRYRPDIDGVRAIAVLLVVGFHVFPRWVPGGFVGVDVFFVISGFLISRIIVHALERDRFSYATFYARRIKRIFPALALVLVACLPVGWLILFQDEYHALGREIAAGGGFIANLEFWRESGYFDADAAVKPLLHLWSLGVEEQFYLTWPLILVAVARRPRAPVALTCAVLGVASFILNVVFVRTHPEAAFYSPATRFWELLIGCVLAWIAVDDRGVTGPVISSAAFLRSLCAWAGLAGIVFAAIWLSQTAAFPGWWALLPTVGTALIVAAGPETWPNRRILSRPLLVAVGLISYPLYLWHWPLLVFARINAAGELSRIDRIGVIAASMALAAGTYLIVEKPIRFGRPTRVMPLTLGVVMALLVGAGAYVSVSGSSKAGDGGQSQYVQYFENSPPRYRYSVAHDVFANFGDECNFYDARGKHPRDSIAAACVTPATRKSLLIWGDSHAAQFNVGLRDVLPPDVSILEVATSACTPALGDRSPDPFQACNKSNRFAMDTIRRVKPRVVLLAQRADHELTDWHRLAAAVTAAGAGNVVLIGPVAQWKTDLHKLIARKYWEHTPEHIPSLSDETMQTNATLGTLYRSSTDVRYISVIDRLCDGSGCLAYLNGDRRDGLIAQDYGHLTHAGSTYIAGTIIAPAILPLLADR